MGKAKFAHLHVHTEGSPLDGACIPSRLASLVKQHGGEHIAATDHGSMSQLLKLQNAADKEGLKAILGIEAYFTEDRTVKDPKNRYTHLTLLAENDTGLKNLYHLNNLAFQEGFYAKPRMDYEILKQHGEGVIVLSGCLAGYTMQALMDEDNIYETERDRLHAARDSLLKLIDCVGKENVYAEVQNVGIEFDNGRSQRSTNRDLYKLANDLGLVTVGTADIHFLLPGDADFHDTMLCASQNKTKADEKRLRFLPQSYHVRTYEEMVPLLEEDAPGCLANTLLVAERCDARIKTGGVLDYLPEYDIRVEYEPERPCPDGMDPSIWRRREFLRDLSIKGLRERVGDPIPSEYMERLEYELTVINDMGVTDYFLILWDIISEAVGRGVLLGPGRGSGAGSCVLWALDVTQLDPIEHGLLFERFLAPSRVSMPDVDIDFSVLRRKEMMEYSRERFGQEKTAQIITFSRIGSKAGIRRAAATLGRDYLPLADKMSKLIPTKGTVAAPLSSALMTKDEIMKLPDKERAKAMGDSSPELQALIRADKDAKWIADQAQWLEGMIAAESVHAAALIISPVPVDTVVPVQWDKHGASVSAFDMKDAESIGLLKMDFLGLRNLDIIQEAIELIRLRTGKIIDPYKIPLDDKKTYEMMARGDSVGVFQFESAGMQDSLRTIGVTEFNDLVAIVAAYRPGAMDQIPIYARRKRGLEPVTFGDPRMEPILGDTYGSCLTGDAVIMDASTGALHRMRDVVEHRLSFPVQGIDINGYPAIGKVSNWMDNGVRDVFKVTLSNGMSLTMTGDHRVWTDDGWQRLDVLKPGDHVGVPHELMHEGRSSASWTPEKLRLLGYLIGDGSLSNSSAVVFCNSEQTLLDQFTEDCLREFPDCKVTDYPRERGVHHLFVSRRERAAGASYHDASSCLQWLRDLGLKHARGGVRSEDKHLPEDVFTLPADDIARLLAALWDCDGHVGASTTFFKTISRTLADDVQRCLMILGLDPWIYQTQYVTDGGVERTAYQVSVKDGPGFSRFVLPHMIHPTKTSVNCGHESKRSSIPISILIAETREAIATGGEKIRPFQERTGLPVRALLAAPYRRKTGRVAQTAATQLFTELTLPTCEMLTSCSWVEIRSIEPAGRENVYDITVDGTHSFVANGMIVHNCLYQEQSMLLSRELAGFTGGLMDTLRKAIGKKNMELMQELKPLFYDGGEVKNKRTGEMELIIGCKKNGVPKDTVDWVWNVFEASANYSFNKSHAAAYGLVSYITAYLKANYPAEYMAALISSVMTTKDKVPPYVYEARRMGLKMLPPDVNHSYSRFRPEYDPETDELLGLRYGMTAIKNVGESIVEAISAERDANGPYANMFDLARRVEGINKREIEFLIKAGALDSTGAPRMGMLEVLPNAIEIAKKERKNRDKGQESLFGALDADPETELAAMSTSVDPPVPAEEFTDKERFSLEREATGGLYVSGHPLDKAMLAWEQVRTIGVGQLEPSYVGKTITVCGIVSHKKVIYTRRDNKRMLVVTLEDLTGTIEVTFFPKTVENDGVERHLNEGEFVTIVAKVEKDERSFSAGADLISDDDDEHGEAEAPQVSMKLIGMRTLAFNPDAIDVTDCYRITMPQNLAANRDAMAKILTVLRQHPGPRPVEMAIEMNDGSMKVFRNPEITVERSDKLSKALQGLIGA